MPASDFPLVAVMLGWPAIFASIALVFVGVARRRAHVALVGAVLALPFLLYLLASPRVGGLSLIVGALYLGSSGAIAHSRPGRGAGVAIRRPGRFRCLDCAHPMSCVRAKRTARKRVAASIQSSAGHFVRCFAFRARGNSSPGRGG